MKLKLAHIVAFAVTGIVVFSGDPAVAQKMQQRDSVATTIIAGPQYKRSSFHNFLWGKHYRKEWITPVIVHNFYLDTAFGGLTPYEAGGSRQTESLKLHDNSKREYVLRGIDKTFSGALPELYRNTFIERVINDQVSIAHPYGAVMVAPMAQTAGIYHTWPSNVFVPKQKALGKFNSSGDKLYLFEQRPDGNWQTADNFGNAKKIIGTDKLFENLHSNNKNLVDQEDFVRARLFDMFIGDWGRHEDQWRWAEFEGKDATIYKPVPRDRDQAFTKFDGVLLKFVKSVAGLSHQQSFGPVIKNIRTYNFAARNLDRVMTNQTTSEQWINIAKELQQVLTDDVIENAVRLMPKEVFPISGNNLISNLKSRRDHLQEYAEQYFKFLAEEVDVTGSEKNEYFEIYDDASGNLIMKAYDLDHDGNKKRLFYDRTFPLRETSELRVYGLGGKDIYDVNLTGTTKTKVRIIGDQQNDQVRVASDKKLNIYNAKSDTLARYKYDAFKYNKAGISPSLYYSKQQHIIYVGIAYKNTKYKWGKQPFASMNEMYLHYSPTQHALRTGYDGVVNNFVGKWSLLLNASYDWVKVINFYGLGNDTKTITNDRNFYRLRSESGMVSVGLSRQVGLYGNFVLSPFFQTVKLLNDQDRFLVKNFLQEPISKDNFATKKFMGASAVYRFQKVDDEVVPTKGVRFIASAAYTKNISDPKESFGYGGDLHFYFPLTKHFVLAIKNGAANITGDPEFYQLNPIGGRRLRGYRRERFWGNTAFYNNNELQYLINFRSFLFNGKAGLMAFADQGRVWLNGENSNTWHYGYGGGIIIAPFNKIYLSASYGISPENRGIVHLDLRRTLK